MPLTPEFVGGRRDLEIDMQLSYNAHGLGGLREDSQFDRVRG
ncbi:hypothetical protein APR12_004604 [Nocardia amikacinitolerans]|nr:hypothetical protein [Nocardia amikacinitolerans]MCP2319237.1 hypothetical protein [Nocardia amikacinitolerans]